MLKKVAQMHFHSNMARLVSEKLIAQFVGFYSMLL